jgi:glycosyltransferase involved in cell wall biosynthesis
MPRLDFATTAVSSPMGAQVYEEQIARRATEALDHTWRVSRTIVRSVRSDLPGTHRLPFNHLDQAPATLRRAVGRLMYPRGSVVHRMDLSLPPAPYEVITIHDVVAWKFPDEAQPARFAREESRRAAAVVCPSQYTAGEAMGFLGIKEPYVIHHGVDERFFQATALDERTLRELGVPDGPFILHAGGSSLRKNLEGLASAWRIVVQHFPDLNLVLSGPLSTRRNRLFAGLDRTVMVGRVDSQLMPGLMAAAQLVVVPSLYEGFGLPALEAMATGVPVVAANTSSLPEVCGDSAVLVNSDGRSIADGIIDTLSDSASALRLAGSGHTRARRFSWTGSAARHAEVWQLVWESRSN